MKRIAAAAVIALGLMSGAQAATVTYDFTVRNLFPTPGESVTGFFSYDDTNTVTISAPSGLGGGFDVLLAGMTWYSGTAGKLAGLTSSATSIGIIKAGTVVPGVGTAPSDAAAVGFDLLLGTFGILVTLDTSFSSLAISQLNGRVFDDVMVSYAPDGQGGFVQDVLLGISQRSADVPVPATLALLGLGLAGLGAARRKQV